MNIFSFFAGAGFLDLGFEMTGHFNVVYVNEFHKAFNDIYKYARERMGISPPIYGHHVEDISLLLNEQQMNSLKAQIVESKHQALTGIIGGPPCPDFSVAGKNRGKDGDNGKLSGIYAEIVCRTQPDFFLFENVKGLYRTAKHRAFFEQLKRQFVHNGYYLTEQLINALEFGVPQDRERIILIGVRHDIANDLNLLVNGDNLVGFPWNEHKVYNIADVKAANWPDRNHYVEHGYLPVPNNIIEDLTVQHWWDVNDVTHHPNTNMYFQPKAGLLRFQTTDEGDDKKKSFKRLHRWRYSPTVAYGNNEVHIHPYEPRRISVAESLALQSLPREYVIPSNVTLTDAFKTIGNGVPFLAAQGIANSIYDYLNRD